MPRLRSSVVVVVAALAFAACGGSTEGLLGEQLYERSCAGCHLVDGSGATGPAIGPESNSVLLTDEQLAGVILVGPGSMPAFTRFTDEQVDSLVAYVRDLQQQ